MSKPRIAVVGGGPAGLACSRVLWKSGVESTIFERDQSLSERSQGGSLDLHLNSGQFALRHADLFDQFRAAARYEDQDTRLYDKAGRLMFVHSDPAAIDRPEIDRADLRRILLDSLPAHQIIQWGHKLSDVQANEQGAYSLLFEHGEQHTFDLVVGADGAWSKVRPVVSAEQPIYSGVTIVELEIEDVDRQHSQISTMVGRGSMLALGDRKALLAQRNGGGLVRVYAARLVEEDWGRQAGLDQMSRAEARAVLLNEFHGWAPKLLELVHRCNSITTRPLYALPVGHRWANRPGITLIGDAAHLMTPFSGEGVNSALLDATDLALRLTEEKDWKAAIQAYETNMFVRAEAAARKAAERLRARFAPDALTSTLDSLRAHFG